MKDSVVRARIPSGLKADAARVLASCGLDPSEAIRLFLQQVVAHNGLPFQVKAAPRESSMRSLQRLKRKSQARDRRIAASEDVSSGAMLPVHPEALRGAKVRWPKVKLG